MEGRGHNGGSLLRGGRRDGDGFLRIGPRTLSFLTLLGGWILSAAHAQAPPEAEWPTEVAGALECLADEEDLAAQRDALLERADSLGFQAELTSGSAREPLLREIEIVKNQYADLGLDLLLRQEACRTLAAEGVARCDRTIAELQSLVGDDERGRDKARELSRWLALRDRLESSMAAPAIYDYPVLPSSEDETVETLELKLQYYEEVAELLRALESRIEARLDAIQRSVEALRDAWQFVEDLSFADMGDPSPGGDALTQIPGEGSGGMSRPQTALSLDRPLSDLDFALSGSPLGPEQAEAWSRLLRTHRDAVRVALARMEAEVGVHRDRLAGASR